MGVHWGGSEKKMTNDGRHPKMTEVISELKTLKPSPDKSPTQCSGDTVTKETTLRILKPINPFTVFILVSFAFKTFIWIFRSS